MNRVAVVDTNVVAAGLMTARGDAPTARILDGMLTGAFPFALSIALLAEYRNVLNRAALRKRHGLDQSAIESLLVALARDAIMLDAHAGPAAPDPGDDQHLWNLLASHADLCLVTGGKLLLQCRTAPAPMLTPAEFAQRISGAGVHEPKWRPVDREQLHALTRGMPRPTETAGRALRKLRDQSGY